MNVIDPDFVDYELQNSLVIGAPEEIRTPDPLVRSQVLYPAELQAHKLVELVRPKRFELLTPWFVAKYSIQLSYGRVSDIIT